MSDNDDELSYTELMKYLDKVGELPESEYV